jgi:serine/threonine-protein kinase
MRVQKIGRYEVIESLARGGMGVVYKARDPLIDRVVAVKTLGFGLSAIEAEAFRTQFAREAKSAGRLNHPNIVTIHDMGESDDGAYIAMEFLEGRSLRDVLDSGVVLQPAQVAAIALQVAEGLAYAHRNGVVHCDVKPANIMLLADGTAKITDFGIAQLPTGSRTFAGPLLGSPRYIAPEQILGRPVDERSDLFSLGAVIYEMLTGVPPFAGDAVDEILFQVINGKPERASLRRPDVPPALDEIVERAMAKDPGARYASAAELATALRPFAASRSAVVASAPPRSSHSGDVAGATTVSILPPVAEAPQVSQDAAAVGRRRMLRFGVPSLLLVAAIAWTWTMARTDRSDVVASTGTTRPAAAPSPSAAAATEPAVAPPLDPQRIDPPSVPADAATTKAAVAIPVPERERTAPVGANPLARLGLAISPWGEVFVDGKPRGVAPPLTELKLPPGKYEIEIRNSTFAPHRETVELFADAPARVKHKFQ